MPKALPIGKPKTYPLERLLELHREADMVGDIDSRDKLAAKIKDMGGTIATGEIPVDETKMSRLERLRHDALAVNDTDTAEKLAVMIAEEEPEVSDTEEPHTPHEGRGLVDAVEDAAQNPSDPRTMPEVMADELMRVAGDIKEASERGTPVADLLSGDEKIVIGGGPTIRENLSPVNGGMNVHAPPNNAETLEKCIVRDKCDAGQGPICAAEDDCPHSHKYVPPVVPESDEEHLEGPIAAQPVNDGTASVNAAKRIKKEGWRIDEIPASDGGKVTVFDLRRYAKELTQV